MSDEGLRARLRAALLAAPKARDVVAVDPLRGALAAIVGAEVEERLDGARLYDAHRRPDEAARLRAEADVLSAQLAVG